MEESGNIRQNPEVTVPPDSSGSVGPAAPAKPLTSDDIWALLKEKHSKSEWAIFGELRTHTGYGARTGYIDAYAIGMWKENQVCIAYEIKVSRSDFKADVEQFLTKQKAALRNSNQFFYVVPNGLVTPDEIPELAGLIYVTKGGLRTKKIAPFREMPAGALEMDFTRSLMRAAVSLAEYRNSQLALDLEEARKKAAFAAKYGGRELTEEDVDALASERAVRLDQEQIESRSRRKVAERRLRSYEALKRIAHEAGCGEMWHREIYDEQNLAKLCQAVSIAGRIRDGLQYAKMSCLELKKDTDAVKMHIDSVLREMERLSYEATKPDPT